MPYIGSAVKDQGFSGTVKDTFSGDGSTVAFTLSQSSPTNDAEVLVGNVQQEPIVAYSINGATLTFTEAPPSGTDNIYVLHRGRQKDTILPPTDLGDKGYTMGGTLDVTGNLTTSGTLDVTGNLTTSGNLKINNGGTIGSTGTTDAMTVSTGGGITFKNDIQNPRIKVDGTASGTGLFTLQAPDSSTARTLTLPDVTGNVVSTGDSGTVAAAMLDGDQTGSQPIFAARAWIRFNGTGTIAINDSGNVASITDLGTGYYRVTYTTAMAGTDYCVVGVSRYQGWYGDFRLQAVATDKVEFYTGRGETTSAIDQSGINVLVFE